MCGIVGVLKPSGERVDPEQLKAMLELVAHRGPDGSGVHTAGEIGLGHVRLAIQDLSDAAAQPMVSQNARYAISYNGEVYNLDELRDDLKRRNVHLRSTGDTEALLEHVSAFGLEVTLAKVEGMFALALWDQSERQLVLARDRHGIKPLYYSPGREVRFASEMKALLPPTPIPDASTLNATLLGAGGSWGDKTIFRDVRSVRPGEWMVFRSNGTVEHHNFFRLIDFVDRDLYEELDRLPDEAAVGRVAGALSESVQKRMLSDAPVACLASGGVDSCIVAALAAQHAPGMKLYHANVLDRSEISAASELAQTLDLELQSIEVSDADILSLLAATTHHYEVPLTYHTSSVPFYMVSQLASGGGIKVVLTGEGSDEYFHGYARFAQRRVRRAYDRFLSICQKLLHTVPPVGNFFWPRFEEQLSQQLRSLMFRYEVDERRSEAKEAFGFIRSSAERERQIDAFETLSGNLSSLLHRNDRLAMAWGLESRFPFLGHSLVRTAVNLPGRFKIRRVRSFHDWRHPFTMDKWVVRMVAARHLPMRVAARAKYAFQSSVFERSKVQAALFRDGFCCEWLGLDTNAVGHLVASSTREWISWMMLVEVWGRLFYLRQSIDEVQNRVRSYVTIGEDSTR